MDSRMFHSHVAACKTIPEETRSLEIFNYSFLTFGNKDPALNSVEERPLPTYEFDDFLQERGHYARSRPRYGVKLLGGIRLILQKDARHAETFAPHVLSMKTEQYEAMVRTLDLPFRAIEGTSVVGPFFWSSCSSSGGSSSSSSSSSSSNNDQQQDREDDPDDARLHVIFRKSDTRKMGKTEGWEVVLSHVFSTGITTGFVKGTGGSHVAESVEQLKGCCAEAGAGAAGRHPLLLPVILLSHDLGARRDRQLRETRDWVRKLERTISRRVGAHEGDGEDRIRKSMADIEETNRALVECHAQVLRKRPRDWLEIIKGVEAAMERFRASRPGRTWSAEVENLHADMVGRLDFYKIKLRGIEGYVHTTLERLNIQRDALSNVMAHRQSIVNLQMVAMITDQRRIAQASKKDGNAMKRLSIMGAVFLPGTFMASIFSMVFFNYKTSDGGQEGGLFVASQLWVYFAITVPLTLVVVMTVWLWDRKRERKSKKRTVLLEEGLEAMEKDIVVQVRRHGTDKMVAFDDKDDED